MTDRESGIWRDEEQLPLGDLERAMAVSAGDGEVDDVTGNDAGAEAAFGHGPDTTEAERPAPEAATDVERGHRPSTTGRSGPH
jgi:hypothetical protein